ncbi:hypothetical protein F4860DRAFT_264898 [Xylaria cubensis]|nr:hypothetical protein F4860DRAFT_264898 [Xylaria cubensis]
MTKLINYHLIALHYSEKSLGAGFKGSLASVKFISNSPSTQYAAQLESSGRGSFTIAADSAVESESLTSQGDETINPTESELSSDKPAHNDGQEGLRDKEHGRDDNSVVSYSLNPLSAAEPKLGELLRGVGASLAQQENTQRPFTSNPSHPNGFLDLHHEHDNGICQCTMPSEELPHVKSNVTDEIEAILEYTKFCCITQGCTRPDIRDLNLHVGRDEFIARWPFGCVIKFSIDYDSFNNRNDADYALNQLKLAAVLWNSCNIGVQFVHVEPSEPSEPNQSPIIFKLKYKGKSVSCDGLIFARAFFPIDVERRPLPCKLYIFGVSFEDQYRDAMWRTFLHEIAHILGGRHENPPEWERRVPFGLFGSQNDQSVLVGDRGPGPISLHWMDIRLFRRFMKLPEGSLIRNSDGYMTPVRDIVL